MMEHYYVGVDVGTSSVRAALVTNKGHVVSTATHPLRILEPDPDYFEQSSENIWAGCCKVIHSVCSGINKDLIHGLGFDGTCSLVVLDKEYKPLSVSSTGNNNWNVIMWMDHRAAEQAEKINKTKHPVLQNVGGLISLEMETPKLLWIKENLPSCWEKAGHFFDLPDFLTWKATGCLSRSLCCLVCKWTYQVDCHGNSHWNDNYFTEIGLGDLAEEGFVRIGPGDALCPGMACGNGLTEKAAEDLGLKPGLPVAASMIDAYAGTLGCLGCVPKDTDTFDLGGLKLTSKLTLICGTSTCLIAISDKYMLVPGVWGPYYSVLMPDLCIHEGGQSAAGKLLDHIVESHPAYSWLQEDADKRKLHIFDILEEVLQFMAKKDGVTSVAELTHDVHVWPDYHGNRSPLADPSLRGMVSGLSLAEGVEDLALLYLATIQALAYSTRHILSAMTAAGHDIKVLYACGGLSKCHLYIQTHSDVMGLPVLLPETSESVLLGAAILGATASGDYDSTEAAMLALGGRGHLIKPDTSLKHYHDKKYKVFLLMYQHQQEYREIMAGDKQS